MYSIIINSIGYLFYNNYFRPEDGLKSSFDMKNSKDQLKSFSSNSLVTQLAIAKALILNITAAELKLKRLSEINREIFPKK